MSRFEFEYLAYLLSKLLLYYIYLTDIHLC
jgi:hypothetical protein